MRQQLLQNNLCQSAANLKGWWCFPLFFFLLFFLFSTHVNAISKPAKSSPNKETKATLIEYLVQEKTHLTIAINNAEHNTPPKNEEQFKATMQHISSILTMTSAKVQSLEGFLDNQNKQQMNLKQRLKYLQQLPLASAEVSIQERVAKVETLLTVNKKTIELINENLVLAREFEVSLKDQIKGLQLWKQKYELEQKLIQLKAKKTKLNLELSQLYQSNINNHDQKRPDNSPNAQIGDEVNLLINNQHIALTHQNINALHLQKMIIKAKILLIKNTDTKTLQAVSDT